MVPFTYHIVCRLTGEHYYGSRYAKGCDPSDLWNTYFTSSRKVKKLLEQYGTQSFDVEVRRVFETREEAIRWEFRVLEKLNAAARPDWLNQHNGKGRVKSGFEGRVHSEATKQKQSEAAKGRKRPDLAERNKLNKPNLGRKFTEEHRQHISESSKGRKRPDLAERNRQRAKTQYSSEPQTP